MDRDSLKTYYDNPEKSSLEEIQNLKENIKADPLILQLLNSFPDPIFILNKNRHIIAFNNKAEGLFNGYSSEEIFGLRVGEAISCIHAFEEPSGCGTGSSCAECGAAQCLKSTRESKKAADAECRITVEQHGVEKALDLKIQTSLINYHGENFIVFAAKSIEDEKRKKVLQRVFFHDLLNTAGAIYGISSMLTDVDDISEVKSFSSMLQTTSSQLIQEIQAQRDLESAESGALQVNVEKVSVNEVLDNIEAHYRRSDLAHKRILTIVPHNSLGKIETDKSILIRCLANLLKNALEASEENTEIKIWTEFIGDNILFHVKNNEVIPRAIKLQIFQRSFSTKANSGRGLGTYSVKLFAQQYLKGNISFISDEVNKTVFTLKIPVIYPRV